MTPRAFPIALTLLITAPFAHAQSLVEGLGGEPPAPAASAESAGEPSQAEQPALGDLIRHIRVHWRDGIDWSPHAEELQMRVGAQAWTVDRPKYEGPVVIFRARGRGTEDHFFNADQEGFVYYAASWDADVTLSPQNGVEGYDVYVRLLTIEERRELFARRGWGLVERGIDFGEINIARDEALDLRGYRDAAVRVYGTWGVRPRQDTGFFVDLSASVGVAHAKSYDDRSDITNAFGGWTTALRFERRQDRVTLFFENRKGAKNGDDMQTRKAKFFLRWERELRPEGGIGRYLTETFGEDARLSFGLEGGKRSFRWQTENELDSLGLPVHDTYETERFLGINLRLRFR